MGKPIKAPITAARQAAQAAKSALVSELVKDVTYETFSGLLDSALKCNAIAAAEDPPFYSYYDLTKRYGVSRKTVETWELPQHKFGRTIRFRRVDVLAWEAERRES